MSTLFEKLTGKAPWKDPEDEVSEEAGAVEISEGGAKGRKPVCQKSAPRAVNMKEREKDYSFVFVILKWMIPMGVCLVVLFVSFFLDGWLNDSTRATIDSQSVQHNTYRDKIVTAEANIDALEAQLKQDEGRMVFADDDNAEDNAIAEAFFSRYMTWSNSAEYEALRAEFIKIVPDNQSVQECLFPSQWSYHDPVTLDVVSYIDTEHLNLRFDRLISYRTGTSISTAGVLYSAIIYATRDADAAGSTSERLAFYAEYEIVNGALSLTSINSLVAMEDY